MKKTRIFLTLLLFAPALYSQMAEQWYRTYQMNCDYTRLHYLSEMAIDDSGFVYVAGSTCQDGLRNSDFVLIKYNQNGDSVWCRRYTDPRNGNDFAKALALDRFGGVYICGNVPSLATGNSMTVVKFDRTGTFQWVRRYSQHIDPNVGETVNDAVCDNSGNLYVTGFSDSVMVTIKYNSAGDSLWVNRYFDTLGRKVNGSSIKLDRFGNVFAAGIINMSPSASDNFVVVKYNSSGVYQWSGHKDTMTIYDGMKVMLDVDSYGNSYLAGTRWYGGLSEGYYTGKFSPSGARLWEKSYNFDSFGSDCLYDIKVDNQNNIIVTGASATTGNDFDFATIKYSNSGNVLWTKRFGNGTQFDQAYKLTVDASRNVYVCGTSIINAGGARFTTIKYNSSGVLQWQVNSAFEDNSSFTHPNNILTDRNRNIFVAGDVEQYVYTKKFFISKISLTTSINQIPGEIPVAFDLKQNYPNPFNPSTKIRFDVSSSNNQGIKLEVYDDLGRIVKTLFEGKLSAGRYEINWDASNYSSGIYFYRLSSDEFNAVKKMLLIK